MENIDFTKNNGLIPAIIQDADTRVVYMMGYMNSDSLELTKKSGYVYFWSRSKKRLWMKGEQSGNKLEVRKILLDCDNDTLLISVTVLGENVCHTGNKTCFWKEVKYVS